MKINHTCFVCGKSHTISSWVVKHGRGQTCSYQCGRKLAGIKLKGPKMLVERICIQCGKRDMVQPHLAKHRYCGVQCSALAQKKSIASECSRCGKKIIRAPWHANRTGVKYCSKECMYPKTVITCDWCGAVKRTSPSGVGKRNFCSLSCARLWNVQNNPRPNKRIQVICNTCGVTIERQPCAVGKQNYCCRGCFYKAHAIRMGGEVNPSWRGGCEPYYGPNWKQQSNAARKRDEYTCQRCGCKTPSQTLHVHHIKPLRQTKKDFLKANALENLVSLCSSCHKFIEWHPEQMTQFIVSWNATRSNEHELFQHMTNPAQSQ